MSWRESRAFSKLAAVSATGDAGTGDGGITFTLWICSLGTHLIGGARRKRCSPSGKQGRPPMLDLVLLEQETELSCATKTFRLDSLRAPRPSVLVAGSETGFSEPCKGYATVVPEEEGQAPRQEFNAYVGGQAPHRALLSVCLDWRFHWRTWLQEDVAASLFSSACSVSSFSACLSMKKFGVPPWQRHQQ